MGSTQNDVESCSRDQDYAALIGSIASGDQQALTALYDSTSRLIFGLVMRILANRSTAEEVLFDVYTQVWRQAARYDEKRGGPLSWMITIARTRAIDRLRSEKLTPHLDELTEGAGSEQALAPNPEAATALSEMQRVVRSALQTLSPEQREVIELSYFLGMSQSEIATHLRQPLGTVKTRTRLGMMKLREVLGPVLENHI